MWLIFSTLFVIHGSEAPLNRPSSTPILSIDEVITKWKTASKESGPRTGKLRIIKYDHVFKTEKRGIGSFKLPATNLWEVRFEPDPEAEAGTDHNFGGTTFELDLIEPVSYSFNDGKFVETTEHGTQKYSFEDYEIDLGPFLPKIDLMETIRPYQMLMFPHLSEAYFQQWNIEYAADPKADFHIVFSPISPKMQKEVGKIEVILHHKSYSLEAVKFHSPCGSRQTVYLIKYD